MVTASGVISTAGQAPQTPQLRTTVCLSNGSLFTAHLLPLSKRGYPRFDELRILHLELGFKVNSMSQKLTVGATAKRVGISASAVRFYERRGLVASDRLANGYRVYGHQAVDALRFINRAKALGFSLNEIREILEVRRKGQAPCDCVTTMIERNLAAIDQRIVELSALRRQLRALSRSRPRPRASQVICPIIESEADEE
jgi:DNA-binding transcriptional MerR regulator